ncbi:VWA domain-containing protein, partial [Candidatus Poribacteria bacterium]|nr:VWA domain-containing protein [Candidatus Poribacteria bacterium]
MFYGIRLYLEQITSLRFCFLLYMSFYKPYYLYLLLIIPLLLFLYMLKLKRKTQVVSSVILWEQAIEDIKANTLFQRLRRNILLPLQILFLILAILALARPFWVGQGITAKNLVLIMDGSASMKANDIKPSRFESAKSNALKIIQDMEKGGRMMIIEAKSLPKIITDFTTDKGQLKDFISKMSPADTTTDLEGSIQLAFSIIKDVKGSQILLLSDGGGNISQEAIPPDTNIQFVSFGKDNPDNVGITQFEVVTSPVYPSKIQAFVALQNFSSTEKRNINLELYNEESLIDVRELNLAAGERRSFIFDNIEHPKGLLKVFIDVKDDLYIDNSAYFILGEDKPSRTLMVSSGNLFIQKAIETSSVKLDNIYQKPEFYSIDGNYELLIFDGFVPEKLPKGNILLINPGPNLPFGKLLSQLSNPEIINWDRESPIMRFIDLTNLEIDR